MSEWQFTNQFFEEGREHYLDGGSIKDCPYNYILVDQSNDRLVQSELYRQQEWMCGFKFAHQGGATRSNEKSA